MKNKIIRTGMLVAVLCSAARRHSIRSLPLVICLALSAAAAQAPSDAEISAFFDRPAHGLSVSFQGYLSAPTELRAFFEALGSADNAEALSAELKGKAVDAAPGDLKPAMEEARSLWTKPAARKNGVLRVDPNGSFAGSLQRARNTAASGLFDGGSPERPRHGVVAYLSAGPENGGMFNGMNGAGAFYEHALTPRKLDRFGVLSAQAGFGIHTEVVPHSGVGSVVKSQSGPGNPGDTRVRAAYYWHLPHRTYVEALGLNYQTPEIARRFVVEGGARLGWGQKPLRAKVVEQTIDETLVTVPHTETQDGGGHWEHHKYWVRGQGWVYVDEWVEDPDVTTTTYENEWSEQGHTSRTLQHEAKTSAVFISPYAALRAKIGDGVQARVEAVRYPAPSPKQWAIKAGLVVNLP